MPLSSPIKVSAFWSTDLVHFVFSKWSQVVWKLQEAPHLAEGPWGEGARSNAEHQSLLTVYGDKYNLNLSQKNSWH